LPPDSDIEIIKIDARKEPLKEQKQVKGELLIKREIEESKEGIDVTRTMFDAEDFIDTEKLESDAIVKIKQLEERRDKDRDVRALGTEIRNRIDAADSLEELTDIGEDAFNRAQELGLSAGQIRSMYGRRLESKRNTFL